MLRYIVESPWCSISLFSVLSGQFSGALLVSFGLCFDAIYRSTVRTAFPGRFRVSDAAAGAKSFLVPVYAYLFCALLDFLVAGNTDWIFLVFPVYAFQRNGAGTAFVLCG